MGQVWQRWARYCKNANPCRQATLVSGSMSNVCRSQWQFQNASCSKASVTLSPWKIFHCACCQHSSFTQESCGQLKNNTWRASVATAYFYLCVVPLTWGSSAVGLQADSTANLSAVFNTTGNAAETPFSPRFPFSIPLWRQWTLFGNDEKTPAEAIKC